MPTKTNLRDANDEILRLEAVCRVLSGVAASWYARLGIGSTYEAEPCPVCSGRGFIDGAACIECFGVGRRKLATPERLYTWDDASGSWSMTYTKEDLDDV